MGEQIGALGRQPFVQQVVGEPFAQHDLDRLLQPGLADHQDEKAADDHQEAEHLAAQVVEAAMLEGVEEGALPDIQFDLAEGDRAHHDHQGHGEDAEPEPVAGRRHERAQQAEEL